MTRLTQYLRNSPSIVLSGLLSFLMAWYVLSKPTPHLLSWDIFGYYLYLPMTFIYGDPGISDPSVVHEIIAQYHSSPTLYQIAPTETGYQVIMYSMGMAIIYAPFFLIAHVFALLSGYPADGFSAPYEFMMLFGDLFYMTAGIFLFRNFSRRFFSERITFFLVLFLIGGSNYVFLNVGMLAMPHIYLFAIWALALILIDDWYQKGGSMRSVLFGMLVGLMIVCRPTEGLILLPFLLWRLSSFRQFPERIRFLFRERLRLLLGIVFGMFLIGFQQMLYWKLYSGKWIYMSYTNPGEGFEFLSPYTFEFLFSFRKGWFIYTPVMLFAVTGVYFLYRYRRELLLPVLCFLVVNVYVLSSWSNWWYASGFGQRAMIDSYALLALPFGAFLEQWNNFLKPLRIFLASLLGLFLFLNVFQTWQMEKDILNPYRLTYDYYKAVFLKTYVPEGASSLMLVDRARAFEEKELRDSSMYLHRQDFVQDYEFLQNTGGGRYVRDTVFSGRFSYLLDGSDVHAPSLRIPYSTITGLDHAWIKVSCWVMPLHPPDSLRALLYATMLNRRDEAYAWEGTPITQLADSLPVGKWTHLEFFYLTPEIRTKKDIFCVSLWLSGKGKMRVDELRIRTYSRDKILSDGSR